MRILVTSDTHRDFYALHTLVEKFHRTADIFIHLGDGADELEQVADLYPNCKFLNVRGNCDFGVTASLAGCFSCGIARIFYTHGHMYNVKYELESLFHAGAQVQANVILFGHTHVPMVDYRDGVHILNPGSLGMPYGSKPTYGVVDITDRDIVCYINELDLLK